MRTEHERIAALLFYAFVGILAYLAYRIFRPFLVPLAWAGVLVVFCYPAHAWLARRYGPGRAAALSTLGVGVVVIVPMLLVMLAFVGEAVRAVEAMQQALAEGPPPAFRRWWGSVQVEVPGLERIDPVATLRQAAGRTGAFLAARAGTVLQNLAVFLFDLVVVLFAAFFLFRDGATFLAWLRRVLPFDEQIKARMFAQTRDLITAGVTASLVVAAVQGVLGGLAFALLGLPGPVFWGVVMGFFSLLPLVGAWVVWLPAALWLVFTGQIARGLVLAAVGAGIVSSVDNFLRPALLSGRAQLNGLVVFISMLGGVAAFGVLGLVLGPVVVATGLGLLEAYAGPRAPAAAPPAE
jgi:predicted PurR-regulated permease PerM